VNRGALLLYVLAAALVAAAVYASGDAAWQLARSSDIEALAGLAAGLGVLGLVIGDRGGSGAASRPVSVPISIEQLDPAASRERLLQVAAELKPSVEAEKPDIVAIVDALLNAAIKVGASDLHFQPLDAGTRVSFRIAGVLDELLTLPPALHAPLVMRVKVMGRLVTYVTGKPQDGHVTFGGPNGPIDVRVSLLPTNHGEKVVLRVPRAGVSIAGLDALGFTPALLARFLPLLARPQGLIFIAGPTGAGKTTTIYAALAHIKKVRGETTHIATIEDPVEFDLPFLSQTQVRPETGLTFAHGLRSMLRQDPNVMMVGEIRDAETAGIAIQAGLSGHLILTTVHAESAAGVFARLLEIGVEPYALASASVAALSQRLARALCPHCRKRGTPTPGQVDRLKQLGASVSTVYEPVGCARCGNRGYLGRTAIYELLEVTPEVRERINKRVPTADVASSAKSAMSTLLQDAVAKIESGATSFDEAVRLLT
jgi:general secretion pathway protein E